MQLPEYQGLESQYEDIVYAEMRRFSLETNSVLRVKRSNTFVDRMLASATGGEGMASCDAYLFSFVSNRAQSGPVADALDLSCLVELESTGRFSSGVSQVDMYARSLLVQNADAVCGSRPLLALVFDGSQIGMYSYITRSENGTCVVDRGEVLAVTAITQQNREAISQQVTALLRNRLAMAHARASSGSQPDEVALVAAFRKMVRSTQPIKKHRAELMTLLAGIYDITLEDTLPQALQHLNSSSVGIEQKIYEAWTRLAPKVAYNNRTNATRQLVERIYSTVATPMARLAANKDMDLYGYFYEQLAEKDQKKDAGEYYTPRHVVRGILKPVWEYCLRWNQSNIGTKVTCDPFCGSGGFLYEYAKLLERELNLANSDIDRSFQQSVHGFDINEVDSARLNLYLAGDGAAHLQQVATSIRWRHLTANNVPARASTVSAFLPAYVTSDHLTTLQQSGFLQADGQLTSQGASELSQAAGRGGLDLEDFLFTKLNVPRAYRVRGGPFGNCDLVMTNVPYGAIDTSNKDDWVYPGYPARYESNAIRDVIDLLRPAVTGDDGVPVPGHDGGVGVIVVPSGILETPENRPVREYVVQHCSVLAVISLPKYVFAPYTTQKTYVLVLRKRSSDQIAHFSMATYRDSRVFLYISDCDGKANSDKRYPTRRMERIPQFGWAHLHDDFAENFRDYAGDYQSLLEYCWSPSQDEGFGQQRITDDWTGTEWSTLPGRKWCRHDLESNQSVVVLEKPVPTSVGKALDRYLVNHAATTDPDSRIALIERIAANADLVLEDRTWVGRGMHGFSSSDRTFLRAFASTIHLDDTARLVYYSRRTDVDVDFMPEHILADAPTSLTSIEQLVSGLNRCATENDVLAVLCRLGLPGARVHVYEDFYVALGKQFSEEDAYNNVGPIPVFTASIRKPQYRVQTSISGRSMMQGPAILWARKGTNAGGTHAVLSHNRFYVTDVSGTLVPKTLMRDQYHLPFMAFYLESLFQEQVQARENLAQVNTETIANKEFTRIDLADQVRLWRAIPLNLRKEMLFFPR